MLSEMQHVGQGCVSEFPHRDALRSAPLARMQYVHATRLQVRQPQTHSTFFWQTQGPSVSIFDYSFL